MDDVLQSVVMASPSQTVNELLQSSCETPGSCPTRSFRVLPNIRGDHGHSVNDPGHTISQIGVVRIDGDLDAVLSLLIEFGRELLISLVQ